jgi:hypothetical protein
MRAVTVLAMAYATHPERFPAGLPHPPARPVEVWINPPKTRATEETRGLAATRGRCPCPRETRAVTLGPPF